MGDEKGGGAIAPDELKTGYAETEENCKGCEAKALLLTCRAARLAYYRAGRGTPERASAIGKVQETRRAADRFLEGYTEARELQGLYGTVWDVRGYQTKQKRNTERDVRIHGQRNGRYSTMGVDGARRGGGLHEGIGRSSQTILQVTTG